MWHDVENVKAGIIVILIIVGIVAFYLIFPNAFWSFLKVIGWIILFVLGEILVVIVGYYLVKFLWNLIGEIGAIVKKIFS